MTQASRATKKKVADVMTPDPITVGPDTSVRGAAELMRAKRIRHLPVVDATARLLGILTDRDLKHAIFMPALSEYLAWTPDRLKTPRVRDLMTWSVVTTHPQAALAEAGLTLFQRRIGCLPVVEDGRVIGILTERDVLRGLQKDGEAPIDLDAWPW